jgi:hypothetical protein
MFSRCDAVSWARRLLLGANSSKNRVRFSLAVEMSAASSPMKSSNTNLYT